MRKRKKAVVSPEVINRRKFELFKRDPLALELDLLFRKFRAEDHATYAEYEKNDDLEKRILPKKWNVGLKLSSNFKEKSDVPLYWIDFYPSHPVVYDARTYIDETLPILINDIKHSPDLLDQYNARGYVFNPGLGGGGYDFKTKTFYCPIAKGYIPLMIDPGGLNEKNLSIILDEIKSILKNSLKKRKQLTSEEWQKKGHSVPKERQHITRLGDPLELGFIYHIDEETFKKYLKWYDLHMGDDYTKPQGYTFRTIAVLERIEKNAPEKVKAVKEYLSGRRPKGRKSLKGVIGEPVKGEDHVEVAVKLIYQGIHRKPYPARKSKELFFKCPQHGDNCPRNCKNLQESWKAFNKRHSLRKGKMILAPHSHEIADPSGSPAPSKSKGQIMRGVEKLAEKD